MGSAPGSWVRSGEGWCLSPNTRELEGITQGGELPLLSAGAGGWAAAARKARGAGLSLV